MSKITLPGLIDPHVHLRDPGQTHKEDFYTGTCAALSGGYTTVIDMPNNKAPITSANRLKEKITIARQKIVCDVGFYFGSVGDNLDELIKVKKIVLGLKLYLNETTGNFLIDKNSLSKIFKAWPASLPILLHAEDDAVAFVLNLVRRTQNRVHFCHISTQGDLEQIIKAKEENLAVTCGVTPHHLFLSENDLKTLGPFGKMKPPLRSKKDVHFLWKNLDHIDVIESDHAPHTIEEKKTNVPYGVPGLETTLPLLLTAALKKRLTIEDIIRLCHKSPARIFGIKTDPNTKVIVDLNSPFTIHNSSLFTKGCWSPFEGWKLKSKVNTVFIRGQKVFDNSKILVGPGFGKTIIRG